jgi:hypothetical protein
MLIAHAIASRTLNNNGDCILLIQTTNIYYDNYRCSATSPGLLRVKFRVRPRHGTWVRSQFNPSYPHPSQSVILHCAGLPPLTGHFPSTIANKHELTANKHELTLN